MNFVKVKKENVFIVLLFLWILFPIFIEFNILNLPSRSGGWLGFWAQHLGVISAGIVSYLVISYQEKKDQRQLDKDLKRRHQEFIFEVKYEMINSFKKVCQENYIELSKLVSRVKRNMDDKNNFLSEYNKLETEIINFKNDLYVWTNKEITYAKELGTNPEVLDRYMDIQKQLQSKSFEMNNSKIEFIDNSQGFNDLLLNILGDLSEIQACMEITSA
ncbi:hypothetical protein ESZ50_09115 [Weissella muntiaci]|uniref:Uncharacterized protein n=1 Tax=Weissella muntiaci TaxID=2508881 RepID=A0A6C2C313_9LACO|nr:hypothetical protein [Weissella muntiaci]TYC48360.1 hypothetical protein ESZ50_09115 [Weissella muntiaci]